MRISLLSAEYPPQPGGIGDYTQQLGMALATRGQQVRVLTILDCGLWIVDPARAPGQSTSSLVNPASGWGWGCWRDVIAALDRTRPDVLHIQYQTGAFGMHPAINLLPWRLRALPGRPAVVITAHDLLVPYLFPKAGRLRDWVTYRMLADADAVIVTNDQDYATIRRRRLVLNGPGVLGAGPALAGQSPVLIPIGSNIPVAPPDGYDRMAWRARLGLHTGQTLVAYFGLISPSKGLDTLLDAMMRLPASTQLIVIGGSATAPQDQAYATAIHHRLDQGELRSRVTITGHCTEAEVSAHLLAADIAALPFVDGASFRRGSLLAVLAHGVPVVTTGSEQPEARPPLFPPQLVPDPDRAGLTPLPRLRNGDNVLLAPPGDPAALALAIQRVLNDPALSARLRAGGLALAALFSWELIAERHEALYRSLARRAP